MASRLADGKEGNNAIDDAYNYSSDFKVPEAPRVVTFRAQRRLAYVRIRARDHINAEARNDARPHSRSTRNYASSEPRNRCKIDLGLGIGIEANQLQRIFSPFVQLDAGPASVSSTLRGVGLGLAISRDLARAMGGDVTAESTAGAGSVFTMDLRRCGSRCKK